MRDYATARRLMASRHLAGRGIREAPVLEAMGAVPRELFVPDEWRSQAYADAALPIEEGQTISQPFIVALMIEAAGVCPGAHVLEVGAGSGYAAAVISRIASRVHAIERSARLAHLARTRLERLGYDNIEVREGDGARGWPDAAPFDAIIVSAAGVAIPPALRAQLKPGGRLVMPVVGADADQHLILMRRDGPDEFSERDLGLVSFVPLTSD